ncbi:MAG: hypothetical protein SGILL_004186, partial [Bacillariaceae sp.]
MSDFMTDYLAQAWSLQGQLPLLIFIAALLGLGKGGVPGFATVATAATVATSPNNIPGGLGLAVALQVPILTMIDISAAWLHAKDLDFDTIKLLLPLSFVGMFLGQWLDKHLTDSNARMLVGVFLLLILTVQLGKDAMMNFLATETTSSARIPSSSPSNGSDDEELNKLIQAESGVVPSQKEGTILRRRSHSDENDKALVTPPTAVHRIPSPSKPGSGARKPALSRNTQLFWACIVGIVGGAATMLTNAMGPILNVYLLSVVQL